MTPPDSATADEQNDDALPAPKPAAEHVAQQVDVHPRPHEDRSDAGVLHPAHRAP
jgi:hypothetical protein